MSLVVGIIKYSTPRRYEVSSVSFIGYGAQNLSNLGPCRDKLKSPSQDFEE